MSKLLLVVIVIVALALPIAASAQEVAPLWHCDAVTVTAQTIDYRVVATGAGAYWRIKRVGGSTVAGPQQSPTFANVALNSSEQYQVQAADAQGGPWSNNPECVFTVPPLAVVIETFTAACSGVPYGSEVELRWSVSTELFSTNYTVARDGDVVLNVPAACPGCMPGASYERSVSLPDTHGIYSLLVYNGDDLTDVTEFWLAPCAVPTAVKLAALRAQTEPPIPTDNITLEFLGTLAGAALATWFTVNMFVKSMPNWKAKIVAIPAALFWTVGASVLLAYPNVTAVTVFLALANSLLVYFTATGGATMLAARAAAPSRAMANGKVPFNQPWW